MSDAADLVLTNGEVHALDGDGTTAEAVAIRDGEVARLDAAYEAEFVTGVETRVIDLAGAVVLPGFVDAHTHLDFVGRRAVHANLRDAPGPDAVVERLRDAADPDRRWIEGYSYDDGDWDRPLDGAILNRVSDERPVAAFREDLHGVVVNDVALDELAGDLPETGVRRDASDEPTGLLVEGAARAVFRAIKPDPEEMRELLLAAQDVAHRRGVTAVHDFVRRSSAPVAYRELALDDALRLRVRVNYWRDHLDAMDEVGLRTNHGGPWVRTGGVKTFTDGSLGSHTARLADPYADAGTDGVPADERGEWVVAPDRLQRVVEEVDEAGFQAAAHAVGEEAVEAVIDAYERTDDPAGSRHRIEHATLATDDQLARLADLGIVVCAQPNFHRWAGAGGHYERRLGPERAARTNRLGAMRDAGVDLALGSDCMPLDPLFGIHHAVNAPESDQRLAVEEAVRGYTRGAANAGFDEGRLGTLEPGTVADLVVLDGSPWDRPEAIRDLDVVLTVVGGEVVYDGRSAAE